MKPATKNRWLSTSVTIWWVATVTFAVKVAIMRLHPVAEAEVPVFLLTITAFLAEVIGFVTACVAALVLRGRRQGVAALAVLLGLLTIGHLTYVFSGGQLGGPNTQIFQNAYYVTHLVILTSATLLLWWPRPIRLDE